jgi:hypothetical protein
MLRKFMMITSHHRSDEEGAIVSPTLHRLPARPVVIAPPPHSPARDQQIQVLWGITHRPDQMF